MASSQITRGRGRPRKNLRETIEKDLEINELDRDMLYHEHYAPFGPFS